MIVDHLYHLLNFFRHLLERGGLPYTHQRAPQRTVSLHRIGLCNEKDGVAHIPGGKLSPILVELDALTQSDSPTLTIGSHGPLLGQLRNVRPGVAINTDEVFQGRTLIEHATTALQPGKVGVPPQRCHSNDQPLQLSLSRRLRPGHGQEPTQP